MEIAHYRHPLKLFPVELWSETFKHSSPQVLLIIRQACSTFNAIVTPLVINRYYMKLFKGAVKHEDTGLMKKIYWCFERQEHIQYQIIYSSQFETSYRNTTAFYYATGNGLEKVLDQLFIWIGIDDWRKLIIENRCWAFINACIKGHLRIVCQFYHSFDDNQTRKYLIMFNKYHAFKVAKENGHVDILNQLVVWGREQGILIPGQF